MAYEQALAALADSTRRHIFETLGECSLSVAEIAATQPVSRPAVSQHLKVLVEAGLVEAERRGTRRIYRARADGLGELRQYLDGLWGGVLAGFAAETMRQKERTHDPADQEDD